MRSLRLPLLLAGAALLLATGCLTNTQTNAMETNLEDLQAQILLLQKEHAEIRSQIAGQADAVRAALEARSGGDDDQGRVERAEMITRLDAMRDEMEVLLQKLDDTNFRLSALSGDIQATRNLFTHGQLPEPVPAPPPAGSPRIQPLATPGGGEGAVPVAANPQGPGSDPAGDTATAVPPGPEPQPLTAPAAAPVPVAGPPPEEIYNTAYADYTKGNYPLAILGFQDYLARYGTTEFADDALYWVGESYFSQGKYSDSIASLEELIRRYPQGDKVPAAHLKKGLAYLESNRTAQGVVQLSALIENYPQTDEARLARERLRSMGLRDR